MRTDLREALRGLRAGKGATALAFAILTLTLAAGTVTFSVVDAVALRPLPYPASDRLVAIAHRTGPDGSLAGTAPQDYFSWREGTRSFTGLAGAWGGGVARLEVNGTPAELVSLRATANLFDVLDVKPVLGRTFRPDEETPGRDGVVILAHSAWTRAFGADPNVIGRRVALTQFQEQTTYEIIGVLPPDITFPVTAGEPVELFRPYVTTAAERDHATGGRSYGLHVVGRLRPGVTLEQARADIERVDAAARAAYPNNALVGIGTVVLTLHDRVVGPAKSWLLLVLAAVGFVVLVGCVNAASLLLARATMRGRELATRAALGASRGRLARTLLVEGLVLSVAASAAAITAAYWGVTFAKANLPAELARTTSIAIDARVLIASITAAILCGLFAGGVPAWRVSRSALFDEIKVSSAVIGGRRQARSLGAFLVAEVAFVTILLVATTLVVTSFVVVTTADLGFDRRDVMTIDVSKSLPGITQPEREVAASLFFADVVDRVRAVPAVKQVALISGSSAPLGGNSSNYSMVIPGIGELRGADMFQTHDVSPEYFSTMGLRLMRGRTFDANDRAGAPAVAILNDLAARRYFPGGDPIGRAVTFRGRDTRIVGVTQNVRTHGPEAEWRAEAYVPIAQERQPFPRVHAQVVIRTSGSAAAAAPAVREAIRPALAGRTVPEARLVDEAFRRLTADRRFNAGVMSLFGLLAIVIGASGIYGTMSFVVARQARAVGLCMALGASRSSILRSILSESLWRVCAGVTLGLIGARVVANLFTSLVFGVEPTSPAVYAAVAVGLVVLGVLAALVPARRAAGLDPLAALRAE